MEQDTSGFGLSFTQRYYYFYYKTNNRTVGAVQSHADSCFWRVLLSAQLKDAPTETSRKKTFYYSD
jgi:hypothetical protein